VKTPHEISEWVTFSKELEMSFRIPMSPPLILERMNNVLIGFSRALNEEGCRLIGHVKVLIKSGAEEHLFISVTSFDQLPSSKGRMEKEISNMLLTVNAVVYGLSEDRLAFLFIQMLEEGFKCYINQLSC